MTTRYYYGSGAGANLTVLLLLVISTLVKAALFGRPHIIFIVADDLGWNDVGFHGSDQIPTPNIDALAFNGVILNQHYVQPLCTPTRAALLTGRYPVHLGLQGHPLFAAEARALPPGKLLPEYLKELGYITRAVGKWHLGFYKREVLPIFRGFDSHMGSWNGFTSYYDYIHQEIYPDGPLQGFDLRRNLSAAWDLAGRYATDVFTDEAVRTIQNHDNSPQGPPLFLYLAHLAVHAGNRGKLLEAPQTVIDKFRHIQDPNRRTYAAMVSKLDESVGRVVQALQRRQMLEDSIIVFISDNGAPSRGKYPNWGSNYPFRGMKGTLWEGGVRGVGLLWSPLLQQTPRVSNQLMHVTDWLPTLVTAAGGHYLPPDLDGFNLWDSLVYNLPSTRREILLNIDERGRTAAIRFNHWKLMIGSSKNTYDGFLGDSGADTVNPVYNTTYVVGQSLTGKAIAAASSSIYIRPTRPNQVPFLRSTATVLCPSNITVEGCPGGEMCLYDLEADPCETSNVAPSNPGVARYLRSLLVNYRATLAPQHPVVPDTVRANPSRHNNTWSPWVYDGCALYDPSLDSYLNICDKSKHP